MSNVLCISTESFNKNDFPNTIKSYILEVLKYEETLIIYTDHIMYNHIEKVFYEEYNYIRDKRQNGFILVNLYDYFSLNLKLNDILDDINKICAHKNVKILWHFKDIINLFGKVNNYKSLVLQIEKLTNAIISNNRVNNLVYLDNNMYSFKGFDSFANNFDIVTIIDRGKELCFKDKKEFLKILWILQSNAKLKNENTNLKLFNNVFRTIHKYPEKEENNKILVDKVKNICHMDFCVLYDTFENNEDIVVDSYCFIDKKIKQFLLNDINIKKEINSLNEEIISNNQSKIIVTDYIESHDIKEKVLAMNIGLVLCVPLEYSSSIKGVMWLGRYKTKEGNFELNGDNIESMEVICKAAFYLIEQYKLFRYMNNKLIQNEELRATGEMAVAIAHDINNILTPIIGSVQLLKSEIRDDKETLKYLNVIELCAYDGLNITNKVKKLSRNKQEDSSNVEIFNIDNIVLDAVDLTKDMWLTWSNAKGIKINIVKDLKSLVFIRGNSTEIREVFINIIRNAVDAMPKGGILQINSYNDSKYAFITIKDNGVGIKAEILKNIFNPFFTTKGDNGSGLGLSISHNIIEYHKGNIYVDSNENQGTTFTIKLPICDISEQKEKVLTNIIETKNIDFHGNILIVDDQESIRTIISKMIKHMINCKIKSCNSISIKEELKRRKYDIVICDFSMPEINGLEVASIVKQFYKNTYFCLMTGWVGEFTSSKMKNVDFILNKPIDNVSLKNMFNDYNKYNEETSD